MKTTIIENYRFKGETVCSVQYKGKYIFSPKKARMLGFVDETELYLIKQVCYDNNMIDFIAAKKEIGKYDCWDANNKVFCKVVNSFTEK